MAKQHHDKNTVQSLAGYVNEALSRRKCSLLRRQNAAPLKFFGLKLQIQLTGIFIT